MPYLSSITEKIGPLPYYGNVVGKGWKSNFHSFVQCSPWYILEILWDYSRNKTSILWKRSSFSSVCWICSNTRWHCFYQDNSTTMVLREIAKLNSGRNARVHSISFNCDDRSETNDTAFLRSLSAHIHISTPWLCFCLFICLFVYLFGFSEQIICQK